MPPKVISGGDNPYDIHDAKLSSSATAHESSSVTAHEISNIWLKTCFALQITLFPDSIFYSFCILLYRLSILVKIWVHLYRKNRFSVALHSQITV